jgi:hypothetical protein
MARDRDIFQFAAGHLPLLGCPPGIRTPICCSRGSCPTIERGGNAVNKKPADPSGFSILRAGVSLVNPSAPLCSSRGHEADSHTTIEQYLAAFEPPGAAAEEFHSDRRRVRSGTHHGMPTRVKGWVFEKAAGVCALDQQRFDGVPQLLVLAALLSEEGLPLLPLRAKVKR